MKPASRTKARFTALVADDDDNIREILKRALAEQSILADGARDGEAATTMLANKKFDALIVDLRMPRKHGHQLVREMIEKQPRPLICVITGINEPKLAYDLFRRGVDSLDIKPLSIREYAAKIRGMLEFRAESRIPPVAPEGAVLSTETVRAQLNEVTSSFEEAIKRLKTQQADLEKGYVGSVRLLTSLMGDSGKSTGVHANRVEAMSIYIGKQLGMDTLQLRDVQLAALLHEIGQFSMPDRVKQTPPWQLSAEDREQYERYPVIGATLLSEIPGTERLVSIVEHHAENFNGSGFPHGLKENHIPIGARIIRIADGHDTFLMYLQSGDPEEEAKRHLAEKRGIVYDPELFKYAIAYLQEKSGAEHALLVEQVDGAALQVGMELAESIYDDSGRFLARQGAILSPALAERLAHLLTNRTVSVRRHPHKEDDESADD
jgi:response regulator RpfG family c-di-GMP phosphodiesterase